MCYWLLRLHDSQKLSLSLKFNQIELNCSHGKAYQNYLGIELLSKILSGRSPLKTFTDKINFFMTLRTKLSTKSYRWVKFKNLTKSNSVNYSLITAHFLQNWSKLSCKYNLILKNSVFDAMATNTIKI